MSFTLNSVKSGKKQPEGTLGWITRNIAGGAKRAIDYAAMGGPIQSLVTSSLSDKNYQEPMNIPEGYRALKPIEETWKETLPQQYTTGRGQPLEYVLGLEPGYLSPRGDIENYAQHLVGAVGLTGLHGGLNTAGKNLAEKSVSLGKSALNTAGHVIGSDVVRGGSKLAGAPDIVANALGAVAPGAIHSLRNSKQPLINKKNNLDKDSLDIKKLRSDLNVKKDQLKSSIDLEKYKKDLDIEKEALYKKAYNKPEAITSQKYLRKGLQQSLRKEHLQEFPHASANKSNLEAGLNKFRNDKTNLPFSTEDKAPYSNTQFLRDIEKPHEINLDRNIILNDLFPKENFNNKNGSLNSSKLERFLYSNDIKLNELFDYKKDINNINYRTGKRTTSPSLKNAERFIQEGIEKSGKKYPEQVKNFRNADEIHILQRLKKDPQNEKLLKYAEKKFPEEVKKIREGQSIESLLDIKDKDQSLWEYAEKNHPQQVENLNKSKEIENILTEYNPKDSTSFQKALHWLFKASKYLGVGKLIETGHFTKKSFEHAAPETRKFFADNIIDTIKNNPRLFQPEIKGMNQIGSKKESKKKSQGTFTLSKAS